MKEDIEQYGHTPGCLGCRTLKAGLPPQTHSENCRKRIEGELTKTEEGKARIDRSNARINEALAQQIEQADRERLSKTAMSTKRSTQENAAQQENASSI